MGESSKDRLRKILGSSASAPASTPAIPHKSAPPQPTPPSVAPAPRSGPVVRPATETSVQTPTPIEPARQERIDSQETRPITSISSNTAKPTASPSPSETRARLQELRSKMARLSDEFATGEINRMQFEAIYKHYQEQLQQVENQTYSLPGSDAGLGAITRGMTGQLRERHKAQVLSYAIYDNASSMPLATVGTFNIDTSLLVPMLSSFRSATAEIFGAGLRSTEIEGGRWLCFVPGHVTTLIALFSIEPAKLQLSLIEDLHRDFETANEPAFEKGEAEEAAQSFTRIWSLESFSSTPME